MYNQLIYFIVVLLLFGVQRQTGKLPSASLPDILYIAALGFFFIFYCRRTFDKLLKAVDRGISISDLARAYYRAQSLLSVSAIGFLAVYLYGCNLNAFLRVIPGYDGFTTVSGLAGLTIFLLHLVVIWYWSHPVYQIVLGVKVSRTQFIKGQLSFTSVILVPWFLISTVTDLLQFIKTPSFITSDFAQILLISLSLVGFALFGPWLVIRMWGCQPIPQDHVKIELERFCSNHNFKVGGLLLWSVLGKEMLTAGVVGILPVLRYILITSGLMKTLDITELQAVLAHEMGHVRKKHMLLFILLLIMFILFTYDLTDILTPFFDALTLLALSGGATINWLAAHGDFIASVYSLLPAVATIVLMVLYFRFIFGYFLRNCERQADVYAMELIGDPGPLISSLEKIAFRSGRIEDLPSWHHYSIRQRIEFLLDSFKNRDLIRRHNRKLYGSALVFTAVISGFLFAGWNAGRTGWTSELRTDLDLRILERSISEDPGNAQYLGLYGELLYEKGRYSEADSVLRASLAYDPENAEVLNTLAWLYATGPSPFRDPADALDLALKAAAISPKPYILDTLAEAYFINGRYSEALSTIEAAISGDGPERSHYLQQKEKFKSAIEGKLRSS